MNIITINREFGSGGRELGKRMADILGYDYYDKEILGKMLEEKESDPDYVARVIENHEWSTFAITFRKSFASVAYQDTQTAQLIQEKDLIREIAQKGQNCIIVGRDADVFLAEYKPFNIFVCADMEARMERCRAYASEEENLSEKELIRNIKRIDKSRAHTHELVAGGKWGDKGSYHLSVNTTGWTIKQLAPVVADFAAKWFEK